MNEVDRTIANLTPKAIDYLMAHADQLERGEALLSVPEPIASELERAGILHVSERKADAAD